LAVLDFCGGMKFSPVTTLLPVFDSSALRAFFAMAPPFHAQALVLNFLQMFGPVLFPVVCLHFQLVTICNRLISFLQEPTF
jgi:hypothetical protein